MPRRAAFALAAGVALTAASPATPPANGHANRVELEVQVSSLRNAKGVVMLCLTQRANFLDCAKDPAKVTRIVGAGQAGTIRLAGMAPGQWSLLAIHDANRNGKLDTMMGMPTEGFGFSRNPAMRLGPPRYADVRFTLGATGGKQPIVMKYLL